MIGTELIWKRMKKAGPQILITTLTESLGTFVLVSAVFGVLFWATGLPIYPALLLGGIALATAPAPSLSVVNSLGTDGPVTRTLIPMAALDDLVGALVFFMVVAGVSAHLSTAGIPVFALLLLVFLPVVIGGAVGFLAGKILRRIKTPEVMLAVMLGMLVASAGLGFAINSMLQTPVLNFMLIGMSYSAAFANMITEEQLGSIMKVMTPVIGFSMIVVILNLAAPLDYHLVFGAGLYTAVYIAARAVGKIQRRISGRGGHPCARHGEKIPGLHAAASLRRFAGVHRHCGLGAGRPRARERGPHPGHGGRGGSHQ